MEKPFYKGKKFVYALSGIITALVLAILPSVVELEPDTVDMLQTMLLPVLAITFLVITGHGVQDAISSVQGLQNPTIGAAIIDMIAAMQPEPAEEATPKVEQ